jgi:hypothetical protein
MRFNSAICGVIASALVGVIAAACGGDGNGSSSAPPMCLANAVSTDCTPTYAPTFDNVWQYTLKKTCAVSGCHSGSMPTGNMALDNEDMAYTNLLAKGTNSEQRVMPSNVTCGDVVVRLNSKNESYSMPRGTSLPTGDLCSIMQWIAMGATKQ